MTPLPCPPADPTGSPTDHRPDVVPQRPTRGRHALSAAGVLGAFFRVEARPAPDWISWAALTDDAEVLGGRVAEVRGVLAAGPGRPIPEPAVVASLTHLGLVARLVSPLLGAALLRGVLPVAPVGQVHLRLAGANPLPLALEPTAAVVVDGPAEIAAAFHRCWLIPAVEPLTLAVRASTPISPQVLDGNVSSAVAGALRMAATTRPDLTARAGAVLDELLSGPAAGTGHRRDDGWYVRRSCCLLHRLPGAGICGDCVLGERGSGALPAGSPPGCSVPGAAVSGKPVRYRHGPRHCDRGADPHDTTGSHDGDREGRGER